MRKISILFSALLLLASSSFSQAPTPLVESFDYAVGNLIPTTDWANNSGTGSFLQVQASSLSYAGLPASIGGSVPMTHGSGSREDGAFTFGEVTPVDGEFLYASLIVQVDSITGGTQDYFFHLMDGTSNFRARTWTRAAGAGFNFGISWGTTTIAWDTTELAFATPHLIVIRINFQAGQDNASLFVNPTLPGTEPAPTATSADGAADLLTYSRLGIRQGTGLTSAFVVDEIRVATTWADVTTTTLQVPVELSGFSLD